MNHSALPGFLSADSGEFRKAATDEQTVLFWIFPQGNHGVYTVASSARGKSKNRRLIPVET